LPLLLSPLPLPSPPPSPVPVAMQSRGRSCIRSATGYHSGCGCWHGAWTVGDLE
jgi:hypothetical protein